MFTNINTYLSCFRGEVVSCIQNHINEALLLLWCVASNNTPHDAPKHGQLTGPGLYIACVAWRFLSNLRAIGKWKAAIRSAKVVRSLGKRQLRQLRNRRRFVCLLLNCLNLQATQAKLYTGLDQ